MYVQASNPAWQMFCREGTDFPVENAGRKRSFGAGLDLGATMSSSRAAPHASSKTPPSERRSTFPGARFPDDQRELRLFMAPRCSLACGAVMPKGALIHNVQDDRRLVRKLHSNRGHSSAQQLKRTLGYGGGVSKAVLDAVRDVVHPREVRPAFYKAP